MDVSESETVSKEANVSSVPTLQTTETKEFNNENDQRVNAPQGSQAKMSVCITIFVLGLLLLIVVYGLIMQNYWLVGIGCFPLIRRGVNKIFDRYL